MKAKVLCAILVYNENTYHEGEYVEVTKDSELAMLVRGRCVMEQPEERMEQPKTNAKKQERRK